MDETKTVHAEYVRESRPDALVIFDQVVPRREDVRRIDADGHTRAMRRGYGVDQRGHLLEARANDRTASGCHLHEQHNASGNALEGDADRLGIPGDPARAVIDEVARMRHEILHAERFASPQFRLERRE